VSRVPQSVVASSAQRWRGVVARLIPELSKFGVVGALALVVDVGGFNVLRYAGGHGLLYEWPLSAKVLSASASTVVSWLGNRYWTFRHRRRKSASREFLLFVIMCAVGTGIAVACLATSHYGFGLTSALADNISANVVGLALGTAFRFWAYRTHVFHERPLPDARRGPRRAWSAADNPPGHPGKPAASTGPGTGDEPESRLVSDSW
jgi:putative flippase GtrA